MKIKPEDLAILRSKIEPLDTPEMRERYRIGAFPRSTEVKNLDLRYRWDLLWMSKLRIGDGVGIKGDLNLYSYLSGDNIDTALKSIVRPLASPLKENTNEGRR